MIKLWFDVINYAEEMFKSTQQDVTKCPIKMNMDTKMSSPHANIMTLIHHRPYNDIAAGTIVGQALTNCSGTVLLPCWPW